jgi:hypothetical protein
LHMEGEVKQKHEEKVNDQKVIWERIAQDHGS